MRGKVPHFEFRLTISTDLYMTMAPESPILRFHCAFGHMSLRNMKELKFEISKSDEEQVRNCITCLTVKHKSKPTTGTKERNADKVFQHIHVDTAGPFIRGQDTWYIVVIVDQYSRYMHTETTKSKADIKHVLNNWLKEQHQIHQRKPEKITTDKGSEFVRLGYLHPEWYDGKVIDIITRVDLDLAPTGNKQWNGTAERAFQTIKLLQKLVTSHLKSESEAKFFKESVAYATMNYNHLPHSSIEFNQPSGRYFERDKENPDYTKDEYLESQPARLFFGTSYALPTLPMFLEDVIYHVKPQTDNISNKGYFIGYDSNYKKLIRDVHHQTQLITNVDTLGSFNLHQNFDIRKANQEYVFVPYMMLQHDSKTSDSKKILLPKNIYQATNDEIWKPSKGDERFLRFGSF